MLARIDAVMVLVWLGLEALLFALPTLTQSAAPGDDLTRLTVRLMLVYYAVGATLLLLLRQPTDWRSETARGRLARGFWTLGWASYVVHVAVAFHYAHGWSHADAVEHTRAVSGWGGGIYISHLFTLLWGLDAALWWLRPAAYAARPAWIDRTLHAFMAFIVFNGTVIFEAGLVRWLGLAMFAWLGALLVMSWTAGLGGERRPEADG